MAVAGQIFQVLDGPSMNVNQHRMNHKARGNQYELQEKQHSNSECLIPQLKVEKMASDNSRKNSEAVMSRKAEDGLDMAWCTDGGEGFQVTLTCSST